MIEDEGKIHSGFGVSTQYILSHLNCIMELGESIIFNNFLSQSNFRSLGLAGGFDLKSVINRAKMEAIERDAFSFHFINKIPFTDSYRDKYGLYCFKLSTICRSTFVTLVCDTETYDLTKNCLIFGLGNGTNENLSYQSALHSYISLSYNHQLFPTWCDNTSPFHHKHHFYSKDQINRQIFYHLTHNLNVSYRKNIEEKHWEVIEHPSPFKIKMSRYVSVDHPKLYSLKDIGETPPHPFW